MFLRKPLLGFSLVVALALTGGTAIAAEASRGTVFQAGAGRAAIDLPNGFLPLQDFGTEHDKLQTRVLVLDNGQMRSAIVVVDLTSIFDDEVAKLKDIVAQIADVQPDNILICASHTFSAPHIPPAGPVPANLGGGNPEQMQKGGQLRDLVNDAVAEAAKTAVKQMQPAQMSFGTGISDVNVNRNMLTRDGWWQGADSSGASDKSVAVIKFEGNDHRPIAVLLNYAVQSAVMNQSKIDGSKTITADLGGEAASFVEKQYGDPTVAMFLVGAAGDQSPTYTAQYNVPEPDGGYHEEDLGANGLPLINLQGDRLGADAVKVSASITPEVTPETLKVVSGSAILPARERVKNLGQIHPTKTFDYNVNGTTQAPYFIMQIGDVAIVGVQVELSASTGQFIKVHSPFRKTLVMTMVNGAAKYMPDADNYKKITYEAMNSSFGPGSAEQFSNKILDSLKQMHRTAAR